MLPMAGRAVAHLLGADRQRRLAEVGIVLLDELVGADLVHRDAGADGEAGLFVERDRVQAGDLLDVDHVLRGDQVVAKPHDDVGAAVKNHGGVPVLRQECKCFGQGFWC